MNRQPARSPGGTRSDNGRAAPEAALLGSEGAPDLSAIEIFVDADACPVKDEIYRVAGRYGLKTYVVSNAYMNVPRDPMIERVIVPQGPDVADDWIAESASPLSVVVTQDIPLADRCVKAGAAVLSPKGRAFTRETIGMALATRNLMDDLRSAGQTTRGPAPFSPRDRSQFLQALDMAIVKLRRTIPG